MSPQTDLESESSQDIANIYTILKKILEDIGSIVDVYQTTTSVKNKLSAPITSKTGQVPYRNRQNNLSCDGISEGKCKLNEVRGEADSHFRSNR